MEESECGESQVVKTSLTMFSYPLDDWHGMLRKYQQRYRELHEEEH